MKALSCFCIFGISGFRRINPKFSLCIELSSSGSDDKMLTEILMEEINIVVINKKGFKNLDVIIDNTFDLFGRSRTGSQQRADALRAQCSILGSRHELPKDLKNVPSPFEWNLGVSPFWHISTPVGTIQIRPISLFFREALSKNCDCNKN